MTEKEKTTEPAYSKNVLIKSEKYAGYVDVLMVLLADDVLYTKSEVEKALKSYLNKPINEEVN